MKLTRHQRSILAALWTMTNDDGEAARRRVRCWKMPPEFRKAVPDKYFLRYEIGGLASGRSAQSVHLKTMETLLSAGLVKPESADVLNHVRQGICTCSSDRWAITDAGDELVQTWNVKRLVAEER